MSRKYDFGGYATRNDLLCSDGRTIRKNAFKGNDGQTVPLVWQHMHNAPENVLGHALLENREDGVYAYGVFNDTEAGKNAKQLVAHGDVEGLSIYANQLKQKGGDVLHGAIREVSLVLAGANPGAFIEEVYFAHSDETIEDEAIIYTGENLELEHADKACESKEEPAKEEPKEEPKKEEKDMAKEKTVQDVIDTMNEEQKTVLYGLLGEALGGKKEDKMAHSDEEPEEEDEEIVEEDENEEEEIVKHNVFDSQEEARGNVLSHADVENIFADAKKCGSLKDAVLAHAEDYGVDPIDWLFPDAKSLNTPPEFIKRNTEWVGKVMAGVHHTPFSRVKSMQADITEDEARARGYMKGNRKKEEVFTLLKRETTPTTIYKKQKLDRDDIVDITDFDVVSWIKNEMRGMLDEEIARAILVGDGRSTASDDKISELNIRPIWKDDALYAINTVLTYSTSATDTEKAKAFIKACIKSRKEYKGSGNPVLFTTEDMLNDMLLIEDGIGHFLYKSVGELCTTMRVKEIIPVEIMENLTRIVGTDTRNLLGIIVNLNDYNVGADKGGGINMFDDFDIDYNQYKYLMETRCSGALIKPYSAIVVEAKYGSTLTIDPEDQTDTVLGKTVSDVQANDIIINDDSIKGTLKYVSNWTGYSQDPAENSGNFIVLKYAHSAGSTTTVSYRGRTVALDSDMCSVTRVVDKHQPIIVTSTNATTGAKIVRVLDLSGLKLNKA